MLGIGESIFLRNLMVFPIKGNSKSEDGGSDILIIDDILHSQKGEFRELDEPEVSKVVFNNRSNNPVMMLDGEEITGSLQNRIIAATTYVPARSSTNVPVVCVEEGRWDGIGGFRTGYCSYPQVRSILVKSYHKKSDTQQLIWREINRKLTVTRTISATSSMHDIYDNLNEEISRYIEGFESLNHNIVGFIGVAGDRILGCDIFSSPKSYQKFENKLLRSYALDAFEYQRKRGNLPNVKKFFEDITNVLEKKKFRGTRIKLKGNEFVGQALTYRDTILHMSAFPV